MLQQQQIELIHREIDGATTPDESTAARKLVAEDPEARALDADLRRVGRLFQQVGSREPPIHLKQNIMAAVARSAPASPNKVPAWSSPFAFARWSLAQLKNAFDSLTEHTEMAIMTLPTEGFSAAAITRAKMSSGKPCKISITRCAKRSTQPPQ